MNTSFREDRYDIFYRIRNRQIERFLREIACALKIDIVTMASLHFKYERQCALNCRYCDVWAFHKIPRYIKEKLRYIAIWWLNEPLFRMYKPREAEADLAGYPLIKTAFRSGVAGRACGLGDE